MNGGKNEFFGMPLPKELFRRTGIFFGQIGILQQTNILLTVETLQLIPQITLQQQLEHQLM